MFNLKRTKKIEYLTKICAVQLFCRELSVITVGDIVCYRVKVNKKIIVMIWWFFMNGESRMTF